MVVSVIPDEAFAASFYFERTMEDFATRLIRWQRAAGRHDLPWQGADAYRVWLSEVMLQQTQVSTVIPYFQRFIQAFPNIAVLASATEEQVLAHWSGLGYYARGRNLHRAAKRIMSEHDGCFPRQFDDLLSLPGIGRSTAAAICALAYHEPRAILDGNVKRVLARHHGIEGWTGGLKIESQLWQLAEALLPAQDVADYTQGLMDLGATVCTRSRPCCDGCPVRGDCIAWQTGRTHLLPSPKPRKTIPERQAVMLIIRQGEYVLLEKRPAAGVWGGMWCLPQWEDEASARAWWRSHGATTLHAERLSVFTHVFTHFKWHISPLALVLARDVAMVLENGQRWFKVGEALQAAIPVPVRQLLSVA